MTLSQLQQTLATFRQQLAARETAALRTLADAHARAMQAIQPRIDLLMRQIAEKQAAGETIPLSWLYEEKRLQAIKTLITQGIDSYGQLAQMLTTQLQQSGVTLGSQAAQALLDASVPNGVSWVFGLPSQSAMQSMIGATQAGSPLADLFNGFGAEAAQQASDALVAGITLGDNPKTIARSLQDALNVSQWRAQTIARTELNRAYRSASMENYRANADVVSQWRWTASLSSRTCAACLGEDGNLYDLDEELQDHPCGRCFAVPVTKSWSDILGDSFDASTMDDSSVTDDMQSGADWFAEQDAGAQQEVLGKAKYQAYADGQFQLSDVVGRSQDATWGDSIYERSLKDTLKSANASAQAVIDPLLEKSVPELASEIIRAEEQAALAAEEAAKAEQAIQDAAQLAAEQAARDAQVAEQAAATLKEFTPLTGTLAEKEQFLRDNGYGPWMDSLSVAQRKEVQGYTSGIYSDMNTLLRTGNRPAGSLYTQADLQRRIDLVQSALLKSSAPTDLLNVRGYGSSPDLLSAFQSALKSGDPFIEKGFCSTTILNTPSFSGIRMTIQIPEGSPGAYIKPVSDYPDEQEYLLPHGAVFRIVDAKEVDGTWSFFADYIGIADA